jgi:hypothetical protein
MGVAGTLLKNRRAGEATSDAFADGEAIPAEHRIVRTVPGVTWGVDISPRGLFTGTAGHP